MKIDFSKTDDLNASLSLNVEKDDYEPRIIETLKEYRKGATIKGFRPGKAPLSLIRKKIGPQVKFEEVHKLVNETLNNYLVEEEIPYLAQPLNSEDSGKIEEDGSFFFKFDIALKPEFDVNLEEGLTIPYYKIQISDEMLNEELENFKKHKGEMKETEEVGEKSYLTVSASELNDEKNEEDLATNDEAKISVELIKDEDIKKEFLGKKKEDEFSFDFKKAYPNDTEQAAILNVEKENLSEISSLIKIKIQEIEDFEQAEITEELLEKSFPDQDIKTEEDLLKHYEELYKEKLEEESNFRFKVDSKELLIQNTDFDLPDEFFKRYLKENDEEGEITDELLEKEYPKFRNNFKWQLIANAIATKEDIQIEKEDIEAEAIKHSKAQFAQYGIPMDHISDEQMKAFVDQSLESEEDYRRFAEAALDTKVFDIVKEKADLDEKAISLEDFKKLYE